MAVRIPLAVRFRAAWHRRPGHGNDGFWTTRHGIHCSACGRDVAGAWDPGGNRARVHAEDVR